MLPCITVPPLPWLLAQASTLAMLQWLKLSLPLCSAMWYCASHPSRNLPKTCLALPSHHASLLVATPPIGAVSGGSLNPAVSFGISSANIINEGKFYNCLIYSAYEFVGAGLAAGVFHATHPAEYDK